MGQNNAYDKFVKLEITNFKLKINREKTYSRTISAHFYR